MIGLYLSAQLLNVTDLEFFDPVEDPYLYTFKFRCTSCGENHPNPITINRYEAPEGAEESGPNSGINFLMKCKFCRNEMRITFKNDSSVAKVFTIEASETSAKKPVLMLKMDTRGVDVVEFVPDGKFVCKGAESSTKFQEVDLSENEWYDYDDNAGDEVSITDIEWSIKRSRNKNIYHVFLVFEVIIKLIKPS